MSAIRRWCAARDAQPCEDRVVLGQVASLGVAEPTQESRSSCVPLRRSLEAGRQRRDRAEVRDLGGHRRLGRARGASEAANSTGRAELPLPARTASVQDGKASPRCSFSLIESPPKLGSGLGRQGSSGVNGWSLVTL
jgi:hypothetical protein